MAEQLPILGFADAAAWEHWLELQHASSPGLWLKIGKKGSPTPSVTYAEALDSALCYGWIDGQKKTFDAAAYLQKFTPRRPKSVWSAVNRTKVAVLIEAGRMRPAGQAAIDAAIADGRWAAAYEPASTATVPPDFQAALEANPAALAVFEALSRSGRYPFIFRIQTARQATTRAKRISQFVALLERGETL